MAKSDVAYVADKNDMRNPRNMIGPNLNFAATEAYKLLRTNLMFSFSDEGKGRAIGITSSIQNEGKSLTACNTAYALAESGKRVLLLEADLRKPTVAAKLGLARSLGLTNMLVSREELEVVVQQCDMAPNMDVVTSGDIPPNPSELLSSNRMLEVMEELKEKYDYIVVDLPPVTVVSDALAISKALDGMVMVVRGGISERNVLSEAMRQLNMVNVPLLGFVYRGDDREIGSYRYKRKYKKYQKYYENYGYGYGYENK